MKNCCTTNDKPLSADKHFVIIGGGSAAFAATIKAAELGARVTMINGGLPIGGTCVNVGCVPSKTLIRAAEAHHRVTAHNFDGIESQSRVVDFHAVIEQKRQLVEQLRQAKYLDVVADLKKFRRTEGLARFVAPNAVEINGERIESDRFLIATGATQSVPDVPGLQESGYLTNETVFDLEELPESMIVLGGRYIALEFAQMFARFGTRVTVLQRSSRILPTESEELTGELTRVLTEEGLDVVTGVALSRIQRDGPRVVVEAQVNGEKRTFAARHLLAATGRKPNTTDLGLAVAGVEVDERGFIQVDDTLQTSVPGIYSAGDVVGEPMFVYTAAYEGSLAARNALDGGVTSRDYTALPWVIFTDPQVAGVGMDEEEARQAGYDSESALLPLSHVPRALAARDTRGFIKLIRDKSTDRLLGGRILAPEGSELTMEISLAIKHGVTASELAKAFHPYLTLSEGIKLAAITFGKDVGKLSCCAT